MNSLIKSTLLLYPTHELGRVTTLKPSTVDLCIFSGSLCKFNYKTEVAGWAFVPVVKTPAITIRIPGFENTLQLLTQPPANADPGGGG